MATDRFEVRIPFTRFLILAVLTVVPICAVGLFVLNRTEQSVDRTIGNHFRTIAQSAAAEVSQFISDRIVTVGALAGDPTIIDAVRAANATIAGQSPDAIAARMGEVEKKWNTPAAEPLVREMLNSRASRALTRWRDHDRRFLRITLTDSHGGVVAATHKTLDYIQADEDFWQAVYASGRGAVHITDMLYDDVTKSYYIGLGVPVMEEGANTFIGAIDALVEVSTIFPLVHRVAMGAGSRTMMVKQDGTIICLAGTQSGGGRAPTIDLSMGMKSEEYLAAQGWSGDQLNRQKGYLVTTLRNGENVLIGYADTGLKQSFSNLAWTVLVAQDTREAFAATRSVMRLILFAVGVGLAMVTLLFVYFMLHRRKDYTDLKAQEEPRAEARIDAPPERTAQPR
jgi:hypothetical protein